MGGKWAEGDGVKRRSLGPPIPDFCLEKLHIYVDHQLERDYRKGANLKAIGGRLMDSV